LLFLPEISSYIHNQLSIQPKDIPLGYSIDRVLRVISPGERSGPVVPFAVARYQAVTGKLIVREGAERHPVEYAELHVQAGDKQWDVPTGKDGEFFLEDVGTGVVELSFRYSGRHRSCDILVPRSEEIIDDLGEVTCEFADWVP